MASSKGIAQLKADEGTRSKAYMIDGVLHIGIGFNLERGDAREQLILAGVSSKDIDAILKKGGASISDEVIDNLFQNTLQAAEKDMKSLYPNHEKMPQDVKDVLVNMSFQLGKKSLRGFTDMNKAIAKGDWKNMQVEMKDSKWNKDTTTRSNRLIKQIGGVKQEPAPPTIREKAVSAKKQYDKNLFDQRVTQLANVMSREAMIDQLAGAMQKVEDKKAQEIKPQETPK